VAGEWEQRARLGVTVWKRRPGWKVRGQDGLVVQGSRCETKRMVWRRGVCDDQ
jgi:hypothetical protein